MSKEHQIIHHEVYRPRGEKLIGTYAGKHVREYDSYDPRLVIDVLKNGDYFGKIIADNFTRFETGVATRLDKIEFVRGHHKARFIFGMGESELVENELLHKVYSPDGLVGFAKGDNLDFYIASLLYDDPKIDQIAKEGRGSFDEEVQRYLEKSLDLHGLFKNQTLSSSSH